MTLSDAGWRAGHGKRWGVSGEEMVHSDLIVIWGTNPVSTQVNVMTHAPAPGRRAAPSWWSSTPTAPAPPSRRTCTALRPGTDGALACAVMHVLFRDGYADRDYLARYADDWREGRRTSRAGRRSGPRGSRACRSTDRGLRPLYGSTGRSFLRLGFGFTRSRNGAANMHAASCLPVVTGAWQYQGGGALYNQGDLYTGTRR